MNRAPLVLHVLHHLRVGGMENGVVNLINHMPAARFRHAIVCVEDYSDFRQRIRRPDVEVLALHRSRIGVWGLRKQLYQLCGAMQPAILHSRNLSGLDALLPARLAGVQARVHGEHGRDVDDLDGENNKFVWLRRLHRPLVSRYITVSQDLENYLAKRVGVPPQRVTQIYNGVDTERFSPARDKPDNILPPHFCAPGNIVIGTVGRLDPVKDQATLIKAFVALCRMRPDAPLYLAIAGDGPLRAELEAQVAGSGFAERICLTGAIDAVPELLRSLDIFVLPSLAEGISNTILEALASGLPVITTAVGGNVELVRENECGAFFAPRDETALAKLLLGYIDNEAMRRAHGAAARNHAVREFSMAAMVNRYMQVYDEVLAP